MTRSLPIVVAAALSAAAAFVLPAAGQQPAGRTLTFTSTQSRRDFTALDLGRHGESVGDRFEFATTLRQAGRVAGRLESDCVGVDATYRMLDCGVIVLLADGRLTMHGGYLARSVPGVGGTGEQYAVTGGTGAYAGASGTMRRRGNGTSDTVTITLTAPQP
jgi:hypothetical protein